jgi:hypothetical protein
MTEMFLSDQDIEQESLRQGDIISEVQYFGCMNINNILTHQNAAGTIESWGFKIAPVIGPAIILSHSCEIDKANGIKLTSIILSPLRDINSATAPDKIEELKHTNFITHDSEFSYLKYFYISPHKKLPHKDGAVVDFSKCFSLHKSAYDTILSNKIIQLKQEISDNLALKFSLYFYRKKNIA